MWRSLCLTGCLLMAVSSARAQDDAAKAVLDKALKAHGGAGLLKKYPAIQVKGKGTMELMGMSLSFTTEDAVHYPDKVRTVVDVEIMNQTLKIVHVYDGKKAWSRIMDKLEEITDEKELEEYKHDMHARRVTTLIGLDAKDHMLALIGDVKVKDREAVGVRVSAKGRRDVALFFDKQTHLLLKAEHRAAHPITMAEVNQEEFFEGYKDVDGIKTAMKLTMRHDDKPFLVMELTEARYLERLDAALFGKP